MLMRIEELMGQNEWNTSFLEFLSIPAIPSSSFILLSHKKREKQDSNLSAQNTY